MRILLVSGSCQGVRASARPDRAHMVTVRYRRLVPGSWSAFVPGQAVHDAFAAVVSARASSVGVTTGVTTPLEPGACAPLYDLPTMSSQRRVQLRVRLQSRAGDRGLQRAGRFCLCRSVLDDAGARAGDAIGGRADELEAELRQIGRRPAGESGEATAVEHLDMDGARRRRSAVPASAWAVHSATRRAHRPQVSGRARPTSRCRRHRRSTPLWVLKPVSGIVVSTTLPVPRPFSFTASFARSLALMPESTLIDFVSASRKSFSFSGFASVPALSTLRIIDAMNCCCRLMRSMSPRGRP